MFTNAGEETIECRRLIKDFINKIPDLGTYQIPTELLKEISLSHQRANEYKEAKERLDKEAQETNPAKEKLKIERDIKNLVEKKEACVAEFGRLLEMHIQEREPEFVDQALTMKRKADVLGNEIEEKKKQLKSIKV